MSDRAAEQQGRQYILSLRPQWMEKILRGEKLVDVRQTQPAGRTGEDTVVWLYETRKEGGRGRIVAWCRVPEIHSLNVYRNPAQKQAYARLSGMTEEALEEYQRGRRQLHFWVLEDVHELTEQEAPTLKALGAVCPPMSWRTVKRGCEIWL